MSLEIKLKKVDRIYREGDLISGIVVVTNKGGLSHNGVNLLMEGKVKLELSSKNVGLFEAFYNSLKPITMVSSSAILAKPGKLPDGKAELPFEFKLQPLPGLTLFETYHGVFINITYTLSCDIPRPLLAKDLQATLEFLVEQPTPKTEKGEIVNFTITPETLENVKKSALNRIPKFKISGSLNTATCEITQPFTGQITIENSEIPLKSVEIQLLRVETCGCADGYAREATEIQNIQVVDGGVTHSLAIPLFMVFPRLFTCCTMAAKTFKIEFEVNLVVMLSDGHLVTKNFPIKLVRSL